MSKTLDLSNLEDLSDEDLLYAHQRNLITDEQLAERLDMDEFDMVDEIAKQGGAPTPVEEIAHTGDANTGGLTTEQLERELERRRRIEARENPTDDEDEEEGLTAPYDAEGITNDDLRAEIARRNADRAEEDQLSLEGRKADLIATLEADDEDYEE